MHRSLIVSLTFFSPQPEPQPHLCIMPAVPPTDDLSRFANVDIGQTYVVFVSPSLLPHHAYLIYSIECSDCHRPCFQARFSNSQLNEYRQQVARQRRNGPIAKLPRCVKCTPQAMVELYCSDCRATKEISCFSKQQRKKPDDAVSAYRHLNLSRDYRADFY